MVQSTDNKKLDNICTRSIVLPARFTSLENVRNFVVQIAEQCEMPPKSVFAVELAIDEAFTNIIEHAYGGESDDKIECTCTVLNDRLIVELRDCGVPFRPNGVPEPDLEASLEERKIGGLGMHFMRELMDEVQYSFSDGPGNRKNCNVLTMVKYKE